MLPFSFGDKGVREILLNAVTVKPQEPEVRARIRQYYMSNPEARMSRDSFAKAMPHINAHTINHHLGLLLKEGFLTRPSHGVYALNPAWVQGQIVDHGQPFGRGGGSQLPMTTTGPNGEERREVPDTFPFDVEYTGNTVYYMVSGWSKSILDRMRALPDLFSDSDLEFVSRTIAERYPPRRRTIDGGSG